MPGKVVIPLAKGDYLTESGYNVHLLAAERRRRLIRAIRAHSYRDIVLRLNATAIRIKNMAPVSARKIRADMKYLKAHFGQHD